MIAQDQGMRQHQGRERMPGSIFEQDLVGAKGDASAGRAAGGGQDLPDGQDNGATRAQQLSRSDGAGGNVYFQASIFAERLCLAAAACAGLIASAQLPSAPESRKRLRKNARSTWRIVRRG